MDSGVALLLLILFYVVGGGSRLQAVLAFVSVKLINVFDRGRLYINNLQ